MRFLKALWETIGKKIVAEVKEEAIEAVTTKVEETIERISKRKRSSVNQTKVDILVDLLSVIDDDDVDKFFLTIIRQAEQLDYKFKADPLTLLQQIERAAKS